MVVTVKGRERVFCELTRKGTELLRMVGKTRGGKRFVVE